MRFKYRHGVVYFAQLGGLVKIGSSANPYRRVCDITYDVARRIPGSTLERVLARPSIVMLAMIRTTANALRLERSFHRRFSAYQVDRLISPDFKQEWFTLEGELAEYISGLRSGNPYMVLECDHVNDFVHCKMAVQHDS